MSRLSTGQLHFWSQQRRNDPHTFFFMNNVDILFHRISIRQKMNSEENEEQIARNEKINYSFFVRDSKLDQESGLVACHFTLRICVVSVSCMQDGT